jgi:peptidoglycan LD-endopeptidase LytH
MPPKTPGKPGWQWARRALMLLLVVLGAGLLWPEDAVIPVQGARTTDWNPRTFWHAPWGASGVHKGIDIFAPQGRPVVAAVPGLVLYTGTFPRGGHVALVLGPRWRVHYYAHLQYAPALRTYWVSQGDVLGAVGTSGNAIGKAPHLHYSVVSLLPLPWRYSTAPQGWKQMFYLDPGAVIAPAP